MKENIPNLVKEIDIQVQKAQRFLNKMDAKKAAREKKLVTYKRVAIRP